MKILRIMFALSLISIVLSCTNDQNLIETQTVQLKFENNYLDSKSENQSNFINYSLTINSLGEIQLNDNNLSLIEAVNKRTGKKSFVVIQKNSSFVKKNENPRWKTGYFFDGECFIYGTMFYGDNDVNLFTACGINCIGFDNICPNYNESFV